MKCKFGNVESLAFKKTWNVFFGILKPINFETKKRRNQETLEPRN